jgi:hypothetical protein
MNPFGQGYGGHRPGPTQAKRTIPKIYLSPLIRDKEPVGGVSHRGDRMIHGDQIIAAGASAGEMTRPPRKAVSVFRSAVGVVSSGDGCRLLAAIRQEAEPAKPIIIFAQIDGSGIGGVGRPVRLR